MDNATHFTLAFTYETTFNLYGQTEQQPQMNDLYVFVLWRYMALVRTMVRRSRTHKK